MTGRLPDGGKATVGLSAAAKWLAMWPTPHASCSTGAGTQGRDGGANLQTAVAEAALWATPTAEDGRRGNLPPRPWDTGVPLSQQVASGPTLDGSPDATAKPAGSLNPAFVCWLQGYPTAWMDCAPSKLLP